MRPANVHKTVFLHLLDICPVST